MSLLVSLVFYLDLEWRIMVGKKRIDEFTQTELSVAAQDTYFKIMELWQIDDTDAMRFLGFDYLAENSYFEWKRDPKSVELSKDKFERLSYIFGIYKALQ